MTDRMYKIAPSDEGYASYGYDVVSRTNNGWIRLRTEAGLEFNIQPWSGGWRDNVRDTWAAAIMHKAYRISEDREKFFVMVDCALGEMGEFGKMIGEVEGMKHRIDNIELKRASSS